MKYKKSVEHETVIKSELKRCADEIASLDVSMQTIRELLQEMGKSQIIFCTNYFLCSCYKWIYLWTMQMLKEMVN